MPLKLLYSYRQDFLRNVPDSLLGCELFEEWTDVLEEEEEEEERVQEVKRYPPFSRDSKTTTILKELAKI